MAHRLRLSPRHQQFLDLACQFPEADIASVETYVYFLRVASDIFAQQQAFFGRYELSEGKLLVLQLLRQSPQYRLTPSALAEAAGVPITPPARSPLGAGGRGPPASTASPRPSPPSSPPARPSGNAPPGTPGTSRPGRHSRFPPRPAPRGRNGRSAIATARVTAVWLGGKVVPCAGCWRSTAPAIPW